MNIEDQCLVLRMYRIAAANNVPIDDFISNTAAFLNLCELDIREVLIAE